MVQDCTYAPEMESVEVALLFGFKRVVPSGTGTLDDHDSPSNSTKVFFMHVLAIPLQIDNKRHKCW